MTLDQVRCIALPKELLCQPSTISGESAESQGIIEPGSKSGVEMALEEQQRQDKERQQAAKRRKREARKNAGKQVT